LHTGQHYSYNMDRVFFGQLGLPEARYNLEAGAHGEQTGEEDDGGDREGAHGREA
jgi:UDP-N-acetylglucosamine 2-epimerase (non-hydrolysing)